MAKQMDLFGEVEVAEEVDAREKRGRKPRTTEAAVTNRRRPRRPPERVGFDLRFECPRCHVADSLNEGQLCAPCVELAQDEQIAREQAFFRWQFTTVLEQGQSVYEHALGENDWWWEEGVGDEQRVLAIVERHNDRICQIGGCHRMGDGRRSWWDDYRSAKRRETDFGLARPMPTHVPFDHWLEDWTCDDYTELWDENAYFEGWMVPVLARPVWDVEFGPVGVAALGESLSID